GDSAQRPHLHAAQPTCHIEKQSADAGAVAPEIARDRRIGQDRLGRLVVRYLAGVEVKVHRVEVQHLQTGLIELQRRTVEATVEVEAVNVVLPKERQTYKSAPVVVRRQPGMQEHEIVGEVTN